MPLQFLLAATSFFLAFCQLTPQGQQPDPLKAVLASSQRRSQLEMLGAEPFHLKATIDLYGSDGKVVAKDKLDELWQSPKRYRQELHLQPMKRGDSGTILLEVDNGMLAWRTGHWLLPGSFIYPILQPFYLYLRMPQRVTSQPAPAGNNDLDCVGTEPELANVPAETPIAITTYCMEKGNHILRLVEAPNGLQIVLSDVQPYGRKFIARTIDFVVFGKLRFRVHVDSLETVDEFSALEQTPPDEAQHLTFHRDDIAFNTGELFRGQLLRNVPALFPKPGGDVLLKCHVSTSGEVESVEVLQSSSPALNPLAIAAAKRWKFRASYQNTALVTQDVTVRLQSDGESPLFINP